LWKLALPEEPFSAYYTYKTIKALKRDERHPSLGRIPKDQQEFDRSGEKYLNILIEAGMQPHHRCLDYGCGALRVGRKLINYLEPGNYFGMDTVPDFFCRGLKAVGQVLLTEKMPLCAVISRESLAEGKAFSPDFVISTSVLQHVPPKEVRAYFPNILAILQPHTKALINYRNGPRVALRSKTSWVHPYTFLAEIVYSLGGRLDQYSANLLLLTADWPRLTSVIEKPMLEEFLPEAEVVNSQQG
jgi:SAM-dependent methyltransferase